MRTFSSYGPIKVNQHIYAPRTELIDFACQQLIGEDGEEDGHYITVWAPRQTGKSWVMQQVMERLKRSDEFEVALLTMQSAKSIKTEQGILRLLVNNLTRWFRRKFPKIERWDELVDLFSPPHFSKPVVLILDEFDALQEEHINLFANEFRNIYTQRLNEPDKRSGEKSCLLHGLALIGVRSVLGIENVTGSPFNVQRSLHIPNLTPAEVAGMFHWYEQESGQTFESGVIGRVIAEMQGQPGLTCWLGELLTQNYNRGDAVITQQDFTTAYGAALDLLPNNNILNLISKAKQEPYKSLVLELFRTNSKLFFRYDDPRTNFLYMNGVIEPAVEEDTQRYLKFASPFVQKRLFYYFANETFGTLDPRSAPFADLSDTITAQDVKLPNLLRRYEHYLRENRDWLLKNAPRRNTDFRIFEAVYHFNLYYYLVRFLESYKAQVTPEFPTGNGKLDLLIRHADRLFGIEVKSFVNLVEYQAALGQTAQYAQQLKLTEITLALFIDAVDDDNRRKYEQPYIDPLTGVVVSPVFVITGT
jgi:AAA-like domain